MTKVELGFLERVRGGSLNSITLKDINRIHSKFDISFISENICWNWKDKLSNGYGCITILGKNYPAHVAVYILYKGYYADNLEIDHLCRNRKCVNPKHLEPVTHRINVLRGQAPLARNWRLNKLIRIIKDFDEVLSARKRTNSK